MQSLPYLDAYQVGAEPGCGIRYQETRSNPALHQELADMNTCLRSKKKFTT